MPCVGNTSGPVTSRRGRGNESRARGHCRQHRLPRHRGRHPSRRPSPDRCVPEGLLHTRTRGAGALASRHRPGTRLRDALGQGLAAVLLASGALGAVNATGDEANASAQPGPRAGSHATSLKTAWPTLKSGSRSTDVLTAQHLLAVRGHRLTADGAFGPKTAKAVRDFQRKNRLPVDGAIGSRTWAKLTNLTLASGARGQAVKAAQVQLGVNPDGVFGKKTTAAVSNFQKKNRLTVDGIVRPATWHRLVVGTHTLPVPNSPPAMSASTTRWRSASSPPPASSPLSAASLSTASAPAPSRASSP
ncbi:peptidoglycan-binding protein [Streptomyces sp. NPDC004266]|uniref:peptidoglycan-binding domain-containing protein n=1 Tax=Streptomyces sp. NPDC004266 TaxID=3364693 RepID=UPI0036950617